MTRSASAGEASQHPVVGGRIPSLDGIRGVAILLVCIGHAALGEGAPKYLAPLSHVGNLGVRIFFILSGFLISTLLLREFSKTGRISLAKFYMRRILRIFPAAYFLIASIAVASALGLITLKPGELLFAATFTMNYHDYAMIWLGQMWSLAVEEQFYLIWPLLLILAGPARAIRFAWVPVLLCPLLRLLLWNASGGDETAMTKHFEAVMDSLALGCLLAGAFDSLGGQPWHKWLHRQPWLLLFLATLLVALGYSVYLAKPSAYYIWGQSVANIGIVLGMDWAIRNGGRGLGRVLNWRPLVAVGTVSYSLYLWQNPFFLGSGLGVFNTFPMSVLCAAAAAVISYFLIERPFLKLKEHLRL